MSVRDDLVLIGWLAALAPESAAVPGAGPRATAAVRRVYRDAGRLDAALANCLRRAAATAVLQIPERVDPIAGQRAVLADRDGFAALLDREEAALVAVARRLDALPPLRGSGARLAPLVLEAFQVQGRDLFPREDMGGVALAAEVVRDVLTTVDAPARPAVERELAALSVPAERGRPSVEEVRDPDAWIAVCRDAVTRARAAGDGESAALEALSQAFAEAGRMGPAVAALGDMARVARRAVDAAEEARALQLAGRLLCEAPAGEDDPGRGLVMLLLAADIAASVDPVQADLVRRYVTGFQYTLDDARFARIEPLLEREREEVVEEAFRALRGRHGEELP